MVTKVQVLDQLLHVIRCFEKQSSHVIREVNADGSGKFKRAKKWLEGQGVKFTLSKPCTPQSNSLAERAHGVVPSLACTWLHQAKLPLNDWSGAVMYVDNYKNLWRRLWTVRYPPSMSHTVLRRTYNTFDLLAVAPCTNRSLDAFKYSSQDLRTVSTSATLAVVSPMSLRSIE